MWGEAFVNAIRENPIATSQIFLSIALVAATFAYTYYTKLQVEEHKTDRKTRNQPVIKPDLHPEGGKMYTLRLHNTGNGAAHQLEVNYRMENQASDSASVLERPVFLAADDIVLTPPSEEFRAFIKGGKVEQGNKKDYICVFEITFESILGEKYEYKESIDFVQVVQNQLSGEVTGELKKIRKAVENINKSLSD